MKPFIGHHLNISHGFLSTIDYAKTLDANFFQIFLSNPQKYGGKRKDPNELYALNKKLKKENMKMVIHASYKLNFCNPTNSYIHKAALTDLKHDLNDCEKTGAIGVVVHMGKRLELDKEEAINNYVKGIRSALRDTKSANIILETGAGVGTEVCTNIFELGKLFRRFTKLERERIKFCIDTCHIFAAGYNIGDVDFVDIYCDLIDVNLGWDNVVCIHLNDSKCNMNTKKDNHADLGEGYIKTDGLKKFVKICVGKNIPIVLETPCEQLPKKDQIKMVRNWLLEEVIEKEDNDYLIKITI
ncbi:Ap endonuclease 2 [Fadolivirus algeromassiliense]|jgi:deoxyribonuclease-4|uniref:Ap endonuclease 2 n=1 Tax=Fadolivirus FV1/VV64 TaxID=3070911 RepID=A0A7D3UQY7_9VIRU|nr:Ap endonuclease 2 [Fadolivirus algeromassiliense]QKF94193.1 Ap endonuclease 2 [Fadolivirus FV1/VV64]